MKKIKKGDYGYRNHFKRKQLFIIALLALFIIAQLVGRSFTDNDSVKKILTVMAIVTVLPAANLASPLIAIFKYHTPEQAFHEAYMPYEEKFEVLYDLVLTTPEDVIPSDVTVVHPTGIYVYCINPKLNVKRARIQGHCPGRKARLRMPPGYFPGFFLRFPLPVCPARTPA